MKLGKIIVYVADVDATLAFYEKAFGFKTTVSQAGSFGELDTGGASIAVASFKTGQYHGLPEGNTYGAPASQTISFEIGLVTDNVEEAFKKAVEAGATPLVEPNLKPWGQTGSYLRAPDGTVIDLSSPAPKW